MGIYIDSIKMQGDYTRYLEVTKDGKVYAPFVKGGTVMPIKYANGEPVKAIEIDIVFCKDCIHGKDETLDILEELKIPKDVKDYFIANPITCYMYCDGGEDGMPDYFPPDHYCGFGERKDNELDEEHTDM